MSSRHSPWMIWLRAFGFAFLVLCVVAKPALGTAGELHRLLNGSEHAGSALQEGINTPVAHDGDELQSGTSWHALMHVDLCCGNAAIPSAAFVAAVVHGESLPQAPVAVEAIPAPFLDLFRPPISG
jgi:hypothetical protein